MKPRKRSILLAMIASVAAHLAAAALLLDGEEAVQTAQNFRSGNVELAKALRRNKQGGRYVLYIILFFTAALLLMDWWHG